MDDAWFSLDLPVLDAIVRLREEVDRSLVLTGAHVVEGTGFSEAEVIGALDRLNGTYIDVTVGLGGPEGWNIMRIHPAARTAVGQWPSGESILERLVAGLEAAAEAESDPVRRSRLVEVAKGMRNTAWAVGLGVLSNIVYQRTGLGQ